MKRQFQRSLGHDLSRRCLGEGPPARFWIGGVRPVLERARRHAGHLVKVEIEVDTLTQLREVLDTGLADVVLLDNMSPADMRIAVEMSNRRVVLEASGGITLETIEAVAASGVDYASSGWITHSAPALDVALDIEM